MTEVCFDISHLSQDHFTAACRQQQQSAEAQVQVQAQTQFQSPRTLRGAFPRCAVHGNETFIPRGTSQADVVALFPKREIY